jgi:hypothetical protein
VPLTIFYLDEPQMKMCNSAKKFSEFWQIKNWVDLTLLQARIMAL